MFPVATTGIICRSYKTYNRKVDNSTRGYTFSGLIKAFVFLSTVAVGRRANLEN